jgi:hypothetical protein
MKRHIHQALATGKAGKRVSQYFMSINYLITRTRQIA